ncbi:UbiA family prenyltransferase [Rhizobium sp. WYCCWR 11279]|nr:MULTISPECIES: UbiA family prenyltransferase [Rhizobium]MCH4547406.1 UbiA family prenyltransferase [Rhizobium changzhiense]MCW0019082.1 UbiA family prenyltransferase [Rhizobium sp. BT-226]NKL38746.1 UbiA family prenyltransferase [Rhizobium leguminosarum bv. viciae]NNU48869.1 UbiA family prenyltransferase [Rhizobium changzhiense]
MSELHREFPLRRDFLPRTREWYAPGPARMSEAGSSKPLEPLSACPLVVDLDGTLVRSDLLIETAFSELSRRPYSIVDLTRALYGGKACLKHRLSQPADFDPSILPYDAEVLNVIKAAREKGHSVYLASATHERLVRAVAEHLGLFTGWFATSETTNCAAEVKAKKLVAAFGEGGFDYIGNDEADLPVWRHAAKSYAVRTSAAVARELSRQCDDVEHLTHEKPTWRIWARSLRVHQYVKNGLVFIPLLTNKMFDITSLVSTGLALVAFSLCASGVYLLNDLVDLQDDRRHRTKCRRPLACGDIPLSHAVLAIPILLLLSLAVAFMVSPAFAAVLAGYFALTTAYSFFLKRKMILDVVALASLYTARVIGGAAAIAVWPSPWLLAFMMSWFLSLALVKRYTELISRRAAHLPDLKSRDYRKVDIGMVGALAAGAGMNALTLFALYAASDSAQVLYSRPGMLWLVGPILACWIARILMLANRGQMHDDPVIFAIKDKVSLATLGAAGAFVVAAM